MTEVDTEGQLGMAVIFLETPGIAANITAGCAGAGTTFKLSAAPSTSAQKTVTCAGRNVSLFVLPASAAEKIWRGDLGGRAQVALSDCEVTMLNGSQLLIRDSKSGDACSLSLLPGVGGLDASSGRLSPTADGAFQRFSLPLAKPSHSLTWGVQQIKQAGPARDVPTQGSSPRGREPNATDWQAAAVYNVTLQGKGWGVCCESCTHVCRAPAVLNHQPPTPPHPFPLPCRRAAQPRRGQRACAAKLHGRRGACLLR